MLSVSFVYQNAVQLNGLFLFSETKMCLVCSKFDFRGRRSGPSEKCALCMLFLLLIFRVFCFDRSNVAAPIFQLALITFGNKKQSETLKTIKPYDSLSTEDDRMFGTAALVAVAFPPPYTVSLVQQHS